MLARQERSGLTIRAFAIREGLPDSTLYRWKRRFDEEAAQAGQPPLLPVRIAPPPPPPTGPSSHFEVLLRGGHQVRLGPGFDPDALYSLVQVLEASAACSR